MGDRFNISPTAFSGLFIVKPLQIGDRRGYLERLFCQKKLAKAGWNKPIVQINHTFTKVRGTVRGMHFQFPPNVEMKMVLCLHGEVFDVAVDVRQGSKTFLNWHGEYLSSENGKALSIPEGFAHGFQTMTEDVEMLYFHSAPYTVASEGGLNPVDPKLSIDWPLSVAELSDRDKSHPWLEQNFMGIDL